MTNRPQPGDLVSVTGSNVHGKVDWYDEQKERVQVTLDNGSIATVDIGNVKPFIAPPKAREGL